MIKIGILGSGNVAQHLIVALQKSIFEGAEIEIATVFSRQKKALSNLLNSDIILSLIHI
jgi:pyrroline-5-carboxylate reductase